MRKKRPTKKAPSLFPEEDGNDDVESSDAFFIEQWEVPKNWTWTTVGAVGEVKAGRARSPQNRPGAHATKYLRAANITPKGLDLTDLLEMDFDPEEREIFALRGGDIVLAEASGSPDQVGKSALWNDELPICCFQNTVIRFRPMGVSSQYSLIVFQHFAENGLFASAVRGVGISHLGSERFARFPFPLPPRGEQDRIVAEFSVQAGRVQAALASLESAKQKMILQRQSIVRRELKANEYGSKDKSSANLPAGWSKVRLGDVCEAVNGRAFKTSEWQTSGLPIIRIQNLRDENADFNYYSGEIEDRHIVDDGDLLFAWSGTPGTSFGAFIWQRPRGVLNQHIFKLTIDQSRVNSEFLYNAINLKLAEYIEAAQGGGGLAHITRNQFLDSTVVLAPLKDQARIVEAIRTNINALASQESVVEQNVQKTRLLRQSLLKEAVHGKLVDQDKTEGLSTEHLADVHASRLRYLKELDARRKSLRRTGMEKRSASQKSLKRDLRDVLLELGPLSADELFRKAGYHEERPDDIEEFYRRLAEAHNAKSILAEPGHDPKPTKLITIIE